MSLVEQLKGIKKLPWFVITLGVLYMLQPIHTLLPNTTVHGFEVTHPEYTYGVVYYFIISSFIDLNICYIVYRNYENFITELMCWWAAGHLIDQFSKAAIQWTASEELWIIIAILITICKRWKKKK